ncbi:40S ribosomal protein S21 [Salmonella sp. s51933]|uniref:40S ribosomal protein S21 n=1 Tax=Salmonella sp. s51933 TaxID=3160127 RepID=UPI003754BFF4
MQNEAGEVVDTYIPRRCSVTNRIISAKDHASVQINVGEVDENGRYNSNFKTYALSGFIRNTGDADNALVQLSSKDGVISPNYFE